MLQDPIMSVLSPTAIAYIADIVSRQVRQERENDAIPIVPKPYPAWSNQYRCLQISGYHNSEYSTAMDIQLNIWLITVPGVGPS